jgi:CHAT domain-containing protein/tetratricopeptide (TPR) repeat protein
MLDEWQDLTARVGQLYSEGKIVEAIPLAERALTIARDIFPSPHQNLSRSLNDLGLLYSHQGRWLEAEPLQRESLSIRRQLFGDTAHDDIASSLNNLGQLYLYRGKWSEAESLFLEAKAICGQLYENTANIATAIIANNLALVYRSQGRWLEAEPLYIESLKIRRQLLGNAPNNYIATSINNLAEFYSFQGKYTEAEPLYLETLNIHRELFGHAPNNYLAGSLNNLAELYSSQGKYTEAEPLHLESVNIRRQLFGSNANNDLATSLNNLANLYRVQGKWQEAEPLYIESLNIRRQLFGSNANEDLATSLSNLAKLYRVKGNWREAEPLYIESLNIFRQLFAERGHPSLVTSYQNYAFLLIKQERFLEAGEHFISAARVDIKILANRIQGQTEAERLAYRDRQQYTLDYVLSCLWHYVAEEPETIAQAFEIVYLWKSIATAVEIALNAAIARSDDLELKQLAAERQQLSRQLNLISQRPIENLEGFHLEVNRVQTRINELEKEIAAKVPQYELMETSIDRQAINLLVPAEATLIDFVRFDLYDLVNSKKREPHYLAFVLTDRGLAEIKLVKLGAAEGIDKLIAKFRKVASDLPGFDVMGAVAGSQSRDPDRLLAPYQNQAIELRRVILDPLDLPADNSRVFFAPDGDLNLVPFGILPLDNGIVSDRLSVRYISASRDLRPRLQPPAPATVGTIAANPNYDFPARSIVPQSTKELQKSGTISTLGSKLTPLPQTEPLAQKIAQSLKIEPYLGNAAQAANLRQLRSPQYLIIATHGLHGLNTEGGDNPDPMQDAGLALAGYNTNLDGGKLPPELERGLFTARNLLELDLWGTQIAILLACSSGTGSVRQGEGIFGLKRALAIAGVTTLIVSLWDVPVQASILLMDKFFEYYREGAGKLAPLALQQAQSYIRNITRSELHKIEQGRIVLQEIDEKVEHLKDAEKPLQHPMFWGAWICSSNLSAESIGQR